MGIAGFSLVLRLLLVADAAPAAIPGEAILWFGTAGSGAGAGSIDGPALLDAVAVYTRDLRLVVRAAPGVPQPAARDAASRAAEALRANGARLGFWCEAEGPDAPVRLTIVDQSGKLQSRLVEGRRADRPDIYRAVALKLRAELASTPSTNDAPPTPATSTAAAGPGGPRPPPGAASPPTATAPPAAAPPPTAPAPAAAPPTAPTSPPPAAAPPPTPAPAPPAATGAAVTAVARAAAPDAEDADARPRRVFAALGYRLSAPFAGGGARHAVAAEGVHAPHRALELGLGTELGTRATQSAAAGSVSLFDLPVWASARLVWRAGGRLTLGAGGFAAAHLLWATAAATGGAERAASFTVAAGAGAEALARARLGRALGAEIRVFAEAALPGTRYWVRDVPVLERGARFGAGLGLVFPGP